MRFIGDFHIHSPFSRAVSKELTPEGLDLWGRVKGISVVGTGDFTHPGWASVLREKLEPAEDGVFVLKDKYRLKGESFGFGPLLDCGRTRFLLTAEISSIYKYGGKVRKVHNLIFAPDFTAVTRIQEKIERMGGNIRSDGRPILGIDSRDLLELCLEIDENVLFVPAHIWTPWFSALGAKSGFDSIGECYRDLSGHIHAVETGLSSDPPMNWMCSFLDEYTLISNSDAHSLEKLGREACIFDTEFSYYDITGAIRGGARAGFRGTVEFFPQEGKYHFDGHRKCGVTWDPLTTVRHGGICPVCGRPVVVGVLNRVAQLADRKNIEERPQRDPFFSLVPLKEVLAELEGTGAGAKKVNARYIRCLNRLGPELEVLLYKDIDEIENAGGPVLARSIERMRRRQVHVSPGYDGEYGRVRIWDEKGPPPAEGAGISLFDKGRPEQGPGPKALDLVEFDPAAYREKKVLAAAGERTPEYSAAVKDFPGGLNPRQEEAAGYCEGHSLIIAGPGTGKTRTIVERICRLVRSGTAPETIWTVTFTNKAAAELRDRLHSAGIEAGNGRVGVFTFHGLGLSLLKPHLRLLGRGEDFLIIDDHEKAVLLKSRKGPTAGERKDLIDFVSRVKNGLLPVPGENEAAFGGFREYQDLLKRHNCFDYDDLVYLPLRLFAKCPELLENYRKRIGHLIVDEYQDINPMQYELLLALAGSCRVCAVGDPNQSIYGFRGGSPEFIRRFSVDFPGARTFSLSQSYRCPDTVLRASAQVLGESNVPLSGLMPGVKINIVKTASAAFEAEQIARDIEQRSGGMGFFSMDSGVAGPAASGDIAPSDIAVLCRASLQMPPLEKAFTNHRIPFQTIHTESLFTEEPYRSFLNFCGVLFRKEHAAKTIITGVRNISRKQMETLTLPAERRKAVALFAGLYFNGLKPEFADEMEKELAFYWKDDGDPKTFLERARLASGPDRYDSRLQAVNLMTIHAAKGLEFDLVYIPGCEDALIPCTLSGETASDIEEEKRLLYVAMTRAKRNLVLSCAGTRVIFGKTRKQNESPFLAAIEKALVERHEAMYARKEKPPDDQRLLFD